MRILRAIFLGLVVVAGLVALFGGIVGLVLVSAFWFGAWAAPALILTIVFFIVVMAYLIET